MKLLVAIFGLISLLPCFSEGYRIVHRTDYRYDRPISMGSQTLRFAPNGYDTRVRDYRLKIDPHTAAISTTTAPDGAKTAVVSLREKTDRFQITSSFTFTPEAHDEDKLYFLSPQQTKLSAVFLETHQHGDRFDQILVEWDLEDHQSEMLFLIDLGQWISKEFGYIERYEPGCLTPDELLEQGRGACRDLTSFMVEVLRHSGIPARFASGYLIQPDYSKISFHAWCEAYLSEFGWVGMDATSGYLVHAHHVLLQSGPDQDSVAPVEGAIDECETEFQYKMTIVPDPSTTKN
ncbi:MAG: transglutaminase family protein [Verrucomicrobiota bacterium]